LGSCRARVYAGVGGVFFVGLSVCPVCVWPVKCFNPSINQILKAPHEHKRSHIDCFTIRDTGGTDSLTPLSIPTERLEQQPATARARAAQLRKVIRLHKGKGYGWNC